MKFRQADTLVLELETNLCEVFTVTGKASTNFVLIVKAMVGASKENVLVGALSGHCESFAKFR